MKLTLQEPRRGDKILLIQEVGNKQVEQLLKIYINYDDVDHKTILESARKLIEIVNKDQ